MLLTRFLEFNGTSFTGDFGLLCLRLFTRCGVRSPGTLLAGALSAFSGNSTSSLTGRDGVRGRSGLGLGKLVEEGMRKGLTSCYTLLRLKLEQLSDEIDHLVWSLVDQYFPEEVFKGWVLRDSFLPERVDALHLLHSGAALGG